VGLTDTSNAEVPAYPLKPPGWPSHAEGQAGTRILLSISRMSLAVTPLRGRDPAFAGSLFLRRGCLCVQSLSFHPFLYADRRGHTVRPPRGSWLTALGPHPNPVGPSREYIRVHLFLPIWEGGVHIPEGFGGGRYNSLLSTPHLSDLPPSLQ